MRNGLMVLLLLLCSITSVAAQVSIGIGLPGISIGFNVPVYPTLVRVPGYPVYYAPQMDSNYFFYDGMYWVYQEDNWYASSWYNGPWAVVTAEAVPLFLLRVPVRYYRRPPVYFRGWRSDAPPRWGEHWGNDWEQRHRGWDNWNRSAIPAPAPLPTYQRQYSGNRYPRVEQQQVLQSQNYRYQPHEAVVQQHYQAQRVQSQPASSPQAAQRVPSSPQQRAAPPSAGRPPQTGGAYAQRPTAAPAPSQQHAAPAPSQQRAAPAPHGPQQTGSANVQRPAAAPAPSQQHAAPAPHGQPQQTGGANVQRAAAKAPAQQGRPTGQPQEQQAKQGAAQHPQPPPKAQGQAQEPQSKGTAKEPKQGQEQRGGTAQ